MEYEIYDTQTLLGVLSVQETFKPFWLNWFPQVIQSQTDTVYFDQLPKDRRLAPFVAPNVQGQIMRERGYATKAFKPGYIKPKHVVDPSRAIPRRAGEALGGSLTPGERYDAIIAANMQAEREMIERRWEWMAARAVIDGEVTLEGDNYPKVTVSFGRDPSLTTTLTGAAQWDQSTSDPIDDINYHRRLVQWMSGAPIDTLVFGPDAWKAFSENPKVQALLNAFNRGSQTDYNTASVRGEPYEYVGKLSGSNGMGALDLYVYSDTYEDEDGSGQLVPFLDSGTVCGFGVGIGGFRMFGAIRDRGAQMQSLSMFPKMWDDDDPSVTYTMTQSAPLMVPSNPNNSFTIKVTASVLQFPSIFLGYPGVQTPPGWTPA
jgi:Phage major capsid protein E